MFELNETERDLRHDLQNLEQEKRALQGLLNKAANELDQLSDADCDAEAKHRAEQTTARLRRASSM